MSNLWKAIVIAAVVIIAAIIIVPKMVGTNSGTGTTGGSTSTSSLAAVEKAIKNGKPTLLLLRSAT
jgi:uncharacterized transporter YbjL